METKATAIAAVKQKLHIQEWAAQIEAQQSSGMTVRQWCAENGESSPIHITTVCKKFAHE